MLGEARHSTEHHGGQEWPDLFGRCRLNPDNSLAWISKERRVHSLAQATKSSWLYDLGVSEKTNKNTLTPLQQEVYAVALQLLQPLNDGLHNYGIADFDLEDRASAFATTFPVLFNVSVHKEPETKDESSTNGHANNGD